MRALESRRRRAFAISAATAFALCALLLVPAQPAYADIAGDVNEWLCGLLRDCCNWMFKAQTGVLGSIGATSVINTMCHLHTPLEVGLTRIAIGVVVGGILAAPFAVWARGLAAKATRD